MNRVVVKELSNEEQIIHLLSMIDDNFKLYPEYSEQEKYREYFDKNKDTFCEDIASIIFNQMNCEEYIDYHYIIGVYMHLRLNNEDLSFADIINMMFDKTNNITKIKRYLASMN